MKLTLQVNWDQLEENFKESVAKLPDYKRSMAWEYVKALRAQQRILEEDISELGDQVVSLQAFKQSVDEACNQGDGSYRP